MAWHSGTGGARAGCAPPVRTAEHASEPDAGFSVPPLTSRPASLLGALAPLSDTRHRPSDSVRSGPCCSITSNTTCVASSGTTSDASYRHAAQSPSRVVAGVRCAPCLGLRCCECDPIDVTTTCTSGWSLARSPTQAPHCTVTFMVLSLGRDVRKSRGTTTTEPGVQGRILVFSPATSGARRGWLQQADNEQSKFSTPTI